MTRGDGQAAGEGAGVAPLERIFTLDALRGFALMGIALVNVQGLIGVRVPAVGPADRLVENLVTFFVEGRFYPIFAFLFGVGFFVFMRNAERKGYAPRALFARRLGALLLFGVAHQFLQPGEALLPYAVFGFLLLPLHKARTSVLLALSAPSLALGVWLIPQLAIPGLFMVGAACGRAGLFERPDEHRSGLRLAALAFLILSAAGLGFQWYAYQQAARGPSVLADYTLSATYAAGLAMAGLYVVVLTLLLRRSPVRKLFRSLAAYGRMALTNYIGATLFFLAGAHVLGRMGVGTPTQVQGVLLCLALYALQVPLSVWWLSRFRMGPLEWAWRALTYGVVPPFAKAHREAAGGGPAP